MPDSLQTVAESTEFIRKADGMLDQDGRKELIDSLSANPLQGDLMPGTGGFRKLRWPLPGRGKRGSIRVITFYSGADFPVFLITLFGKNEKSNLSNSERRELAKLSKAIVSEYSKRSKR